MVDNNTLEQTKKVCCICGKQSDTEFCDNGIWEEWVCSDCDGDPIYGEMGYFDSLAETKIGDNE